MQEELLISELRKRYIEGESPTRIFDYAQVSCDSQAVEAIDVYELFLAAFFLDSAKLQLLMAWAKRIPELSEDEINYLLHRAIEEKADRWKTQY